jgi:integrase
MFQHAGGVKVARWPNLNASGQLTRLLDREAGLERLTPHEGRHTFASLMIAAGVNAKALSTYMGHASSRSRSTATAT